MNGLIYFKLFNTFCTPFLKQVIANFQRIFGQKLHKHYKLMVLNALTPSESATNEKTLAASALPKISSPPELRVSLTYRIPKKRFQFRICIDQNLLCGVIKIFNEGIITMKTDFVWDKTRNKFFDRLKL